MRRFDWVSRASVLWVGVAAGCSGADPESEALPEREAPTTAAVPAPATLDEPRFDVGGVGIELYRVQGAAAFDDGGIAIADAGNFRVVILSSSGAFERNLGREGTGPGEFRSVGSVAIRGDTVVVYDAAQGRVAIWLRDGTALATQLLPEVGGVRVGVQAVVSATTYIATSYNSLLESPEGLHDDRGGAGGGGPPARGGRTEGLASARGQRVNGHRALP